MIHRVMQRHARFLVILDTMWGRGGQADRWFMINPDNHSGRRLYRLTHTAMGELWVTNACPEQTTHATRHGEPNAEWLLANLHALTPRLKYLPLLVCGKVAQATYAEAEWIHMGPVIRMPHPAARTWTMRDILRTQRLIARRCQR